MALSDIVAPNLRVLFVAINPAPMSADKGMHFATPTNSFWRLLDASKLTSRLYLPIEATQMVDEGLGLVSLVDRPTRMASQVTRAEMREGAIRLAKKVKRLKPQMLALLGLTLLPYVLPEAEPGPGAKAETFAGARVFVVPNPSGRNRSYPGFAGKLPWYQALAASTRRPS